MLARNSINYFSALEPASEQTIKEYEQMREAAAKQLGRPLTASECYEIRKAQNDALAWTTCRPSGVNAAS